jgi:hypothetical protein
MGHSRNLCLRLPMAVTLAASALVVVTGQAVGQSTITVNSSVPTELNPPFNPGPPQTGGAPAATPEQAAAFAWQEFIALNWPAGPQQGQPGQRDAPSSPCKFGDPSPNCALLVWETFRGKAEIFPGDGNPPPGYTGSNATTSWGYDALPAYNYAFPIAACDSKQSGDATPWINLDETDQITLDNMYAGVVDPSSSPGNSAPQLIRFLAKANRTQYVYVAGNSDPNNPLNQWWSQVPTKVVNDTKAYLAQYQASPPAGSKNWVSLPNGTIEVKAGWRPVNPSEIASGRFHTQRVRFYENAGGTPCYRDAVWGLVALHIIQKTPSAPYFIYATFEQADNILTANGEPIEDADGNIIVPTEPLTATSPQVCLVDPPPSPPGMGTEPSTSGMVILTDDPARCQPAQTANYCGAPGSQLYYRNATFAPPNNQPSAGNICVNKRDNAIPDYVIAANKQAHAAISAYLQQNNIRSTPWLAYKLVNVQYYPYDKIPNPNIPNGSPYTAQPPYTATNPAPSSYYQANIVVETNRSLQLFSGGLSPNISTQWNQDASRHRNTYYNGNFYNMGGCMGCHGSQGQNPAGLAGDFSVILARGAVTLPEVPAMETSKGLTRVRRNRNLSK